MVNWKEHRLAELAEIVMGQSPKGETCNDDGEGVPLLNGPTEFGSSHPDPVQFTIDPKKFAEPLDILFCVRGSTTGRMNWANQTYAIGRGIAAIRHRKGSKYRHFIKGLIEYNLETLLRSATGSTFPNVSRDQLNNLVVKAPETNTQESISEILASIDDKIELNNQINKNLEALAQALFKQWFIDFEFPNENGRPYKSNGGEMVESELGMIPKRWKVGEINDIGVNIKKGINPKQLAPDTIYIGLEHVPLKQMAISDFGYASDVDSHKSEFEKYDILFGKLRPYFHKVVVAPFSGICSTDILVIRPKKSHYLSFLTLHLFSNEVVDYATRVSGGTRMPRVSWSDLKQYPIAISDEILIKKFESICINLIGKMIEGNHENNLLASLRNILLPKLISGELELNSRM